MSAAVPFSIAALAIGASFAPIAAHAQTLTTLYNFKGGADGATPVAGVIYNGGLLYGITGAGGGTGCHRMGCGTVYAVNSSTDVETVVSSLKGDHAYGGLTYQNGKLYGTDYANSKWGWGVVFKITIAIGKENLLYQFKGAPDAANPFDTLIYHDGVFYGTTAEGGALNYGTVFSVNARTGAEALLYSFTNGADGGFPEGGLIFQNNIFYGTTSSGGTAGLGTVFSIDTATGTETVLHSFAGKRDGAEPYDSLIFDHGFLYGTTSAGGTSKFGTVFKVRASTGVEKVLYSFTGGADGANPQAKLNLQGGDLYGTTASGGTSDLGTIFVVNASTGEETVLHSFTGGADGGLPEQAGLTYQDGAFYGTTSTGGSSAYGTVFELVP